jgi:hypothetical protein
MRAFVAATAAIVLSSCSTLENIHDPQFGLLSADQVPELIKSVRCELITFYAANAARKRKLDEIRSVIVQRHNQNNNIPLLIDYKEVLAHSYFNLDTDLYGAFVLEAKVQDTEALLGTSSTFSNVIHSKTGNSKTLTLGPSLNAQGTYDMNYNYAIQQDDTLSDVVAQITEDELIAYDGDFGPADSSSQCYRAVVRGHYDELAEGKYSRLERFHRISVDGGLPLAAWLEQNTTIMGVARNILKDDTPQDQHGKPRIAVPVAQKYLNEAIDPGQMSYIFTVQYTAGIDAKFSLVASPWNPLTTDSSLSFVQTGVLTIYINSYMAGAALGAKGGTFAIVRGPVAPPVQQVLVVNGYAIKPPSPPPPPQSKYPPVLTAPAPDQEELLKNLPALPPAAPAPGPNRGQPIFPITPFVLTPGP